MFLKNNKLIIYNANIFPNYKIEKKLNMPLLKIINILSTHSPNILWLYLYILSYSNVNKLNYLHLSFPGACNHWMFSYTYEDRRLWGPWGKSSHLIPKKTAPENISAFYVPWLKIQWTLVHYFRWYHSIILIGNSMYTYQLCLLADNCYFNICLGQNPFIQQCLY